MKKVYLLFVAIPTLLFSSCDKQSGENNSSNQVSKHELSYILRADYQGEKNKTVIEKRVEIPEGDDISRYLNIVTDTSLGAPMTYLKGIYLDENETQMIKASQLYNFTGEFNQIYLRLSYDEDIEVSSYLDGNYKNALNDKMIVENASITNGSLSNKLTFTTSQIKKGGGDADVLFITEGSVTYNNQTQSINSNRVGITHSYLGPKIKNGLSREAFDYNYISLGVDDLIDDCFDISTLDEEYSVFENMQYFKFSGCTINDLNL